MLYFVNVFLLPSWLNFKSHLHFAFIPSFTIMVAMAIRAAKIAAALRTAAPNKAPKAMEAKQEVHILNPAAGWLSCGIAPICSQKVQHNIGANCGYCHQ